MVKFCAALLLVITGFFTAVAQNSRLLVLNKEGNSLSIIEPVSGKTIAEVPVGQSPHEITVSDDGKFAYIANYGIPDYGHSISIIDVVANKEVERVDVAPFYRPHYIQYSNGGVYFTSEGTRTIGHYNLKQKKVDWQAGTGDDGTHMLVLVPGGKKIYTANRGSNTVTSIEINQDKWPGNIKRIETGKRPEGLDVSPNGKEVWVGNTAEGTIDIIDVATDKITKQITVGQVPIRIKFTPDGKRVLVSDNGTGEVIVVEAASRNIMKRIKPSVSPMGVLIRPDGKEAYIACGANNTIEVLDMQTLKIVRSFSAGKSPDGMAWIQSIR